MTIISSRPYRPSSFQIKVPPTSAGASVNRCGSISKRIYAKPSLRCARRKAEWCTKPIIRQLLTMKRPVQAHAPRYGTPACAGEDLECDRRSGRLAERPPHRLRILLGSQRTESVQGRPTARPCEPKGHKAVLPG